MPVRLSALALLALAPFTLRGQTTADWGAFQGKVIAKYGSTAVATHTAGAMQTIELTMSDKRFRGMKAAFTDSAKSIARFAVSVFPAGYRPDSIRINIITADTQLGVVHRWETSSTAFVPAKLK